MGDWPTSRCRSCNQPVIWALTTANQKRMPVDPTPVLGGNVVLTSGPTARVLTAEETERRRALGSTAWTSHFTTCPQAKSWSRS